MNPLLKYYLKRLAALLGMKARPSGPQRTNLKQFCAHLKYNMGYEPSLVIDVGVADGTFEIYTIFPKVNYLLVEPLEEFLPAMRWIAEHYPAQIVVAAAAAEDGRTIIRFGEALDEMHGATIVPAIEAETNSHDQGGASKEQTREVVMRRVDSLVQEAGYHQGSVFLKVDTQGSEVNVIMGASRILERIDVIVLEVSLFNFNQLQPEIVEVLGFMSEIGYVPYDVFSGATRPLDDALGQVDIAFVKRDGIFREDHSYAPPQEDMQAFAKMVRIIRRRLRI